jgi:predicted ATP-grasp superfamily ATP-dependent carboligase
MDKLELVAIDKILEDVSAIRIEISELREEIKKLHPDDEDEAKKKLFGNYLPRG